MPGFPVLHHLPELAQTLFHCVSDDIHPFHTLSSLNRISLEAGKVFSSLEESSTVYCDPHSQRLWHSQAEIDVFLELSSFFHDPAYIQSINILKFLDF